MPQPKHVDVNVDLQQDEGSLFSQAVDLCQALSPQWASLPECDIKVYSLLRSYPCAPVDLMFDLVPGR